MKLTWAHRTAPCHGEVENGDAVFAATLHDGAAVLAVIDGLGHGPNAARAAAAAVEALASATSRHDAVAIVEALHGSLRGTRGAAATVCTLRAGHLVACGVGNVALRTRGTQVPFVLSPGILGGQVRAFRRVEARLASGDRLLLHSDGISARFSLEDVARLGAEEACTAIFERHWRANDDGTVLVVDVGV